MRRLAAVLALALAACTNGGAPSPSAAPTTRTTTPPAPSPGLLVYASGFGVHAYDPATLRSTLLADPGPVAAVGLAVSGRYAAFANDDPRVAVTVVDLTTKRTRTWTAPDDRLVAHDIGGTDTGFVVVDETTSRLLRFDPEAVLAGRGPTAVPLRGLSGARLLTTSGARVLVATGEPAARFGGPDTVYEVTADGSARRLFRDGEGVPTGEVRTLAIVDAALTADGTRLVYGTGRSAGECDVELTVAVRDLRAGREVPTKVPSLGPDVYTAVGSVTTGPDGRTVVGLSSYVQGCTHPPVRGGAYALDGTAWTLVRRNATWAATGPAGHRAAIVDGIVAFEDSLVAPATFAAWAIL